MGNIRDLSVRNVKITRLTPDTRNPRKHSAKQIKRVARALEKVGWASPLIVDEGHRILAGHCRLAAAELLGLTEVPVISIADMTEQQKRAYVIADNRLAELAEWDEPLLSDELQKLLDSGFDVTATGFDTADIDGILGTAGIAAEEKVRLPAAADTAVSRPGDIWAVGDHLVACGDARDPKTYDRLLRGERAQMVFTDPPYNVPINGHVSGLGKTAHREFVMAAGEMTDAEFTSLLQTAMKNMADASVDGAIHFVCMDWRHVAEILAASKCVYSEFKNLCVWAKTNAGMGAFYRSQHELVFVFKVGTAAHINNFGLGAKGRYRTNLWTYAGVNTFRAGRMKDLAAHPTVKPVQMIADAVLDCSERNGIILDAFAGSGSTLVAAARTGRRGYAIELDPAYVDLCVRRLEEEVGEEAIHEDSSTFSEHARDRGLKEAA